MTGSGTLGDSLVLVNPGTPGTSLILPAKRAATDTHGASVVA
jgi:hypothetical protein